MIGAGSLGQLRRARSPRDARDHVRSVFAKTCLVLVGAYSSPALAADLEWGELSGTFDTTIAVGAAIRTQDPDDSNFCTALGGTGPDCGKSDGNLNYEQGRFTSTNVQATHELDLRWRNLGAFGRLNYFYDSENHDGSRSHVKLSSDARKESGADWQVLDGYLSAEFTPKGRPLTLKFGEQVISWGESTFLPNGINVINPINVNRLRSPGAELREALLPVPAAYASLGVTESLTLEGYWQWAWRETELDPPATFFSTSDGLGPGGDLFDISLGHNDCSTNTTTPPFFTLSRQDGTAGFTCLRRGSDVKPKGRNQWGVAVRLFIPWLNAAELGLYMINYHSRLPYAGGFYGENTSTAAASLAAAGIPVNTVTLFNRVASQIRVQQDYPEDIRKYGVSLSSTIEWLDVALQGEVSWSKDFPLQLSEQQGVRALLTGAGIPVPQGVLPGVRLAGEGEFSSGGVDHRVYTGQFTLTKLVQPGSFVSGVLRASQLTLIAEAGFIRVRGLESTHFRPFQGAATPAAVVDGASADLDASFAQKFSWGYIAVARVTYNNALWGWNLEPGIAFQHDVNGTSPAPIGNYIEDRKAVTLSLRGDYLNRWGVNLGYTTFFGAGEENPLRDRDFLSFSIQYSF